MCCVSGGERPSSAPPAQKSRGRGSRQRHAGTRGVPCAACKGVPRGQRARRGQRGQPGDCLDACAGGGDRRSPAVGGHIPAHVPPSASGMPPSWCTCITFVAPPASVRVHPGPVKHCRAQRISSWAGAVQADGGGARRTEISTAPYLSLL